MGRGSCRQEPSRATERDLDLFRAPGGVGEGFGNIGLFKVRVKLENFLLKNGLPRQ